VDAAAHGGRSVIRVGIADDQALVRAGFRMLLQSECDIEIAGEAADGHEAVALARRERPDILLMDIRMPGCDGLEATRTITSDPELAAVRVVMLTTFELDEYVFEALRGGASGFLVKDIEPEDLARAVRVVASGEALLSPGATRTLIREFAGRPGRPLSRRHDLAGLTEREREVVALVGRGMSNEEIAGQLVISMATARTHVGRAMSKLSARDRAQLAVMAWEAGLTDRW
jgi:DNA-binding NarL/FixJ family response regulator